MSVSYATWMGIRGVIQAALGAGAVASLSVTAANAPIITSPKDGITTKEAWITFEGTGTPMMPVLLYDRQQFISRGEVNNSGKWKIEASMLSGPHQVYAMYELQNGREGARSKPVEFTITDLLAPLDEKLEILNAKDGDVVKRGVFPLRGTTAPGRRIQVQIDGRTFPKTADEEGNWLFNLSLDPGKRTITISTAVEPKESQSITLDVR